MKKLCCNCRRLGKTIFNNHTVNNSFEIEYCEYQEIMVLRPETAKCKSFKKIKKLKVK